MPIHYQCECGATIRVPDWAVGRRARCQTCQRTFTVPDGPAWPETLDVHAQPVAMPQQASIEPANSAKLPGGRDENQDWIRKPARPFWKDLLISFAFLLQPGNLITFVSLLVALIIPGFIPIVGGILGLIVGLYLCSFYFAIVRESASGEDDLPGVSIGDWWDDFILPGLQYAGTWLFVLLPAIIVSLVVIGRGNDMPWVTAAVLAAIGLFFWPIVVLAVAIGGTFKGLWPHVIVRTALAAPLAYLAVCVALLVAAGLHALPSTPYFLAITNKLAPALPKAKIALDVLDTAIGLFVSIVSMRIVGLYYRHYKHKFPWVAE